MRIKTIHKLVLKAYLGPLMVTFFIVIFVLMMNFVWRYIDELTGKGLDAGVIIELIAYATTNMIPLGLPIVMLLAAIMTMGNLGENFELLAMKSAGMSIMQIMKPLIAVVILMSIGSFFLINNLVPYANKKMTSIIIDIRRQKNVMEFKDGLFFKVNDDMSIRVEKQDPETGLLHNVLIYNNNSSGSMTTTIAESGYIRLSDDKRFLNVTLYNGNNYQNTRNGNWYTKNSMRHDNFDVQEMSLEMEGYDFKRTDNSDMIGGSQTKNITELQSDIDSLDVMVTEATSKSYEPLFKDNIFKQDIQVLQIADSLKKDKSGFKDVNFLDSLENLPLRRKHGVWSSARSTAFNSRNAFTFDESTAKDALNQLYRSKNDWHRKLTLPISVIIFFLIGAPLGAIIKKGGLGTPIVISVAFFVIYYIISTSGEKMAKEGTWDSLTGMWISTMVLAPIAVYLLIKATNDASLIDVDWFYNKYQWLKRKSAPAWLPIAKRITSMPAWRKMRERVKARKARKALK